MVIMDARACLVCLPRSLGHVHRTLGELAEHLRVHGMLPRLLNCVHLCKRQHESNCMIGWDPRLLASLCLLACIADWPRSS